MPVIQENVEPLVEEIKSKFPNEIFRVRYKFGEDEIGGPMLSYNILLEDDAFKPERMGLVTQGIRKILYGPWFEGHGYHFRS